MHRFTTLRSLACAVLAVASLGFAPVSAASDQLETLYQQLADPDNQEWQRVQADILREWSKSGSPAMDLLLKRGREAMDAGDLQAAIEHFTALTDHAPDFAEGWNARATAYYLAGAFGPSIADIRRTLALNARHFGALSGLGMILEELGRDDDALDIYRATLAINPHLPNVIEAVKRLERKTAGTEL